MDINNCPFCHLNQNNPDFLVEKPEFFIKLSISPQTKGHSLVIPKLHYQSLSELTDNLILGLFKQAIEIGELLKSNLHAKAYVIKVNNQLFKLEQDSGHIDHIHLHIIPRYKAKEKLVVRPKRVSRDVLLKIRQQVLFGKED